MGTDAGESGLGALAFKPWVLSREVPTSDIFERPAANSFAAMVSRHAMAIPRRGRRRAGNLELRYDTCSAVVEGATLSFTPREFELLSILVERRGRVVQRQELYAAMWTGELRRRDRSIDVLVRRVRLKLAEAAPRWQYIHTHYGFGYRFSPEQHEGE